MARVQQSKIPHDNDAEESLLGAIMLTNSAVDAVSEALLPEHFYRPAFGIIYRTILNLREHGIEINPVTVQDQLEKTGTMDALGDPAILIKLMSNTASSTGARHFAEIIIDRALRRRMMAEGQALAEQAADMTNDALETLESHQIAVGNLGSTVIDREPDDWSVEEFIARPKDTVEKWVIRGVIRRQHKLMLVGPEGGGKSWVLRFIAICAAYGIHPWRHDEIKPIRTLIVDLENPEDALYDSFETILKQVRRVSSEQPQTNRLWWRPAGINLRSRVDLAEFENVIRARRPDLVCLGPLYAAFDNSSKDFGWETAAREVQVALKRLMVRYDFALMVEDHAPQDRSGGMRPYGSSFWRRWPDVGIGMEPINGPDDTAFKLSHWRGSRVKLDWPTEMFRGADLGNPWPFVGNWASPNAPK